MGGLRCPRCGRHIVRRSHRLGVVERLLSALYVYPFRCQLCGRRFRALQWGRRYVVQSAEHREYERVAIRAPLAVATDRGSVSGEVTELSMEGCTATTAAPLHAGATVRAEIRFSPGEPAVAVDRAVVRSVRGGVCSLQFVRLEPDQTIRLRAVIAVLLRSQHDASVPEGPARADGRLRYLRSADFWLVAALVVFIAMALAMLLPSFTLCTWGVDC